MKPLALAAGDVDEYAEMPPLESHDDEVVHKVDQEVVHKVDQEVVHKVDQEVDHEVDQEVNHEVDQEVDQVDQEVDQEVVYEVNQEVVHEVNQEAVHEVDQEVVHEVVHEEELQERFPDEIIYQQDQQGAQAAEDELDQAVAAHHHQLPVNQLLAGNHLNSVGINNSAKPNGSLGSNILFCLPFYYLFLFVHM